MIAKTDQVQLDYDADKMILVITLNRPSRGNALTPVMIAELLRIVNGLSNAFRARVLDESVDDDSSEFPLVRAVLLTGAGRSFCTGMDLKAARNAPAGTRDTTQVTVEFFNALAALPMPTVALVNGPTTGGGTVLLFLCDYVFACKTAFIQFSEVNIGLIPAMISCFIIPKLGITLSTQMMLSGKRYSVQELRDLKSVGIVRCDAENASALRADAQQFVADNLLSSSSFAMAHMKQLVRYVSTHSHEENCIRAQAAFKEVFSGSDLPYGLSCFANKQRPDWAAHLKSKL
eukprot:TRINITY_DN6970_c0_g1_i1.p1 TRINITY_DN6970_c0_g1~~TRINITY_DN6970_c0_g1_i1.p1  ORF type:complete len:303 (+),score=55.30 TRINITY_DN6970_c0_g1_i1:45-911(+)